MEQTKQSSQRVLVIGIAVVVVVIIAVAAIALAMMHSTKKDVASTTKPTTTKAKIATKTDVQQALANVNTTIKQAAADQATAKTAIASGTSQVKVGN